MTTLPWLDDESYDRLRRDRILTIILNLLFGVGGSLAWGIWLWGRCPDLGSSPLYLAGPLFLILSNILMIHDKIGWLRRHPRRDRGRS